MYNEDTDEFSSINDTYVNFESSLQAISKWESKWKVSFISTKNKTNEQNLDYIRCMCLDPSFDINKLSKDNLESINEYLSDEQSATTITQTGKKNKMILTSEVLYAFMAQGGVPFEADTWNISRLLKTLEVISALSEEPKKIPQSEVLRTMAQQNEERKKKYNSKG